MPSLSSSLLGVLPDLSHSILKRSSRVSILFRRCRSTSATSGPPPTTSLDGVGGLAREVPLSKPMPGLPIASYIETSKQEEETKVSLKFKLLTLLLLINQALAYS